MNKDKYSAACVSFMPLCPLLLNRHCFLLSNCCYNIGVFWRVIAFRGSLDFPRELKSDGPACSVDADGDNRIENLGRLACLQLALVAGAHYVFAAVFWVRRHRIRLAILRQRRQRSMYEEMYLKSERLHNNLRLTLNG